MFFTPIDEWMSSTRSAIYRRSAPLQKLDAAIAAANLADENMDDLLREHFDCFGRSSPAGQAAIALEEGRRKEAVAEVKKAFDDWASDQTRKHQDWRNSVRNSSGAVATLYKQIVYLSAQYPSADTQSALNILIEERLPMYCAFRHSKSPERQGCQGKRKEKRSDDCLQLVQVGGQPEAQHSHAAPFVVQRALWHHYVQN
jgi:hypothetical protein